MQNNTVDLCWRISQCDEIGRAQSSRDHSCNNVVKAQMYARGHNIWQVPEPWRGDIKNAALLFISSNPSIDPLDDSPWNNATEEDIQQYYNSKLISKAFPRSSSQSGHLSRNAVSFWVSVEARAHELFQRPVVPGVDFAITELVHCKSRAEFGVEKALPLCTSKYLGDVLNVAGAKVVVCLGKFANQHKQNIENHIRPVNGSHPLVLTLPHPNRRGKRTFKSLYNEQELSNARHALCGGGGTQA